MNNYNLGEAAQNGGGDLLAKVASANCQRPESDTGLSSNELMASDMG
jgi:hypothetical protein